MIERLDKRVLVGVIIVLIGVIAYLVFFQKTPCEKIVIRERDDALGLDNEKNCQRNLK